MAEHNPLQHHHASHISSFAHRSNSRNLQKMLSNLPTSDAFSSYDPSLPSETFPVYLPLPSSPHTVIQTEKTRCLIRALTSKPDRDRRAAIRRDKRKAATNTDPVPVAKRIRWTNLDRERKQACVRVALSAASHHVKQGDLVYDMRETWRRYPRKRQMINLEVRKALVKTVDKWSESQLKTYLERAGLGVVTVEGMIRAVRDHLAPELEEEENSAT